MSTVSTMDAVLKELTKNPYYHVATYENRPLLGTLPKFEGFTGRNLRLPLRYVNAMGRSSAFATAQANATSTKYEDFVLTRIKDYGYHTLDTEGMEAADGEDGSFVDGLEAEVDSIMGAVADSLESALFRSGTGSIGRISSGSTVASATITLANIYDIDNFEVGMQLQASATDVGTLRDSGATETVAAVNRNTGTLTSTSATWDTVITAIAASDYLLCEGDKNLKISGLGAWIPASDPSATTFFSVNRTLDVVRLGGCRFDGSSGSVEEALIDGQGVAGRQGGKPNVCFINNHDYRKLLKTAGSRVTFPRGEIRGRTPEGDVAWVGFKSVQIQGDYGVIDVIPANKCPQGSSWLLQLDTWVLASLGACPRIIKNDGMMVLRAPTDDAVEMRVGYKAQLGCMAPGYNCYVTLPAA